MSRRIARVLLDSPLPQLDRLFDYALPPELGDPAPGVRLRVPLRTAGRLVDAFLVEIGDESDGERALSVVENIVSDAEVLPDRLYRLARRVADRAAGSASDVIRLAVPKRQVRVEKAWQPVTDAASVSTESLLFATETIEQFEGLSEVLAGHGRAAVEAITGCDDEGYPLWTTLLAAAAVTTLAAGESAVLVVPDHRDLDALLHALSKLVPDEAVVRLDARQSNPDRYRAYLRTLDEPPCIVVGNRSAVYSPVRAGLVAVWDDGDSLLSEPLAPYVHARDAALVRQELEGSALLLLAHGRSTDVERLVATGWCQEVHARRRQRPRVSLSTPEELEQPGIRLTPTAFRAAREALQHGPVLVQVARPGFAPTLVCGQCRHPARCGRCGGPLAAHRRGAVPVCGWCGRAARDWTCRSCESATFRLAASGSERTAEELGRAFAGLRIIVADGTHPVESVSSAPALVVATRGAEPRAEGGYRAVLLLDGARMLQSPELRIGESCLRWWSQAAALAAPQAPVHLVGIDGPVARAFATWSHAAFARNELHERAPLHMPPTVRVAQLEGTTTAVRQALTDLEELPLPSDAVLGPLPIGDEGLVRALVRFEYRHGAAVAQTLRARVIAEAVARRRGKGRPQRATLSVRLDVSDPEL